MSSLRQGLQISIKSLTVIKRNSFVIKKTKKRFEKFFCLKYIFSENYKITF